VEHEEDLGVAAPRVTLRDVADRAGVSRTTASFVMTGRRDMRISADAEERVRQAARELNYRPNLVARSLRTNHSQTIGLISDVIATESFAGEVVRGSLATAVLNEHLMFIGETEGDTEVEQRLVQDMLDRGVRGFLYGAMYTRTATLPAILRGHPVVLLNCVTRGRGHAMVVPDEREAGRTAATALLDAGHRDSIVVVGEMPAHVIAAKERDEGIRQALEAAGAAPPENLDCLWWPEPARAAVTAYLRDGGPATAFIALNDRVALGIYQALAATGRSVPGDASVVSFDDSDLAAWLDPPLTSVAIPYFELGRRAVELLLDDDRPAGAHRVPMPLRARGSVAAPPRR
jgi:LacI family transcriptional regulator